MNSAIFLANYCDRRHNQPSLCQFLSECGAVLFGREEMDVNLQGSLGKAPRITWAILRQTGIDTRISSGPCRRTPTAH